MLISDGAAWGIDGRVQGNDDFFSVLHLDLSTWQVTHWFEGPANDLVWPLGVDLTHRLYIQGVNQNKLSGLAGPGSSEPLSNPGPIRLGDYLPGPIAIFSDPAGVWFPGRGGIWSYSDNAAPKQLAAGTPTDDVHPAGPYL